VELDAALAVLRLARRATSDGSTRELVPGTVVGRYEIVGERLGRGGSGDVYPATDVVSGGRFAVKCAKHELPSADRIFVEERHKARLLNHPNILVAYDGGVHEGRPYLVFRLLDGHLTDTLRREQYGNPEAIIGLMQKVVTAVGFAHGRAVLHCDLKPSNILLDDKLEPHVSDFGLARTIEASGSSGDAWGGTVGWMSPEQIAKKSLGVESDVFTLGVLLYWLLSDGQLPFGDGPDFEDRVLREAPAPLPARGRFGNSLWRDLVAIGRKALQKEPSKRYSSAAELLRDLDAVAQGRLPVAVESGFRTGRRALRWVRRHPLLALAGLFALALPPYAFAIQNDALRELFAASRPQSRFSAEAQARAVLSELYVMSLRVHAMAQDPGVRGLIEHGGIDREAAALKAHVVDFDSVNVFSADGEHQARWPVAPREDAINVKGMDHFSCAERLAHELLTRPRSDADAALPVCVARAHRSRLDGKVKLGISAPILIAGRMVGVVEGSTMARDSFGEVRMSCGPGDCFTALLGPRDRAEPTDPLPSALSILAQRALGVGEERQLPVELSGRICATVGCDPDPLKPFVPNPSAPLEIEHYRDPISGASSVAVVAPVAGTGLSVLIATPYTAAHAKLADVARVAFGRLWVPALVAFVVWLLLLVASNPRWPWAGAKTRRKAKA
jgi:hypothetical protein